MGYIGPTGASLRPAQKGRSRRLKPEKQTLQPVSCKASRLGEVALEHDVVGTAVLLWFRQLRRIMLNPIFLPLDQGRKTAPRRHCL